jgi:hypothetical protein
MRRLACHAVSAAAHAAMLIVLVAAAKRTNDENVVELVAPAAVETADDTPLGSVPEPNPAGDIELPDRTVDGFSIDLEKIRAQRATLFPFLTLDLMFLAPLQHDVAAARTRLVNPFATGASPADPPPLEISNAALQEIVDRAWSRRRRWETFGPIATVLTSHAANGGRAADLVRAYLDDNILQPYCDGARRDPRFWAMLENAADHAHFVDFVRSFARAHPSSLTTTELLFLLDELAQGSRDVVLMLMETRPETDLGATRASVPDAWALAVELKQWYGSWLFERELDRQAVRERYDTLRLRLLQTIVETTPHGYRANDARYLAGEILFARQAFDAAAAAWRAIEPDVDDAYFRAYSDVRRVLDATGPVDRVGIRRAIANEYGRWRVFSIDRLKRFGHECDTF